MSMSCSLASHFFLRSSASVLAMLRPQAVLNPLQGFLNVIAYGGLCQWCYSEVKQRMRSRPVEPCVVSWSGEYIDVDFRVGRGNIRRSNRRKST